MRDPDAKLTPSHGRCGTPISIERVEELWQAFVAHPTGRHVATTCHVSHVTAAKYIEHGDPARGIEPFMVRLRRVTAAGQRASEDRIAKLKDRGLTLIDAILGKVAARLKELDATELTADRLDSILDRTLRLAMFLHGEADTRIAVQDDSPESRERRWAVLEEKIKTLPPAIREKTQERLRLMLVQGGKDKEASSGEKQG